MTHYVGLDVSQKSTAICVLDAAGPRVWRGTCGSDPERIAAALQRRTLGELLIGIETGPMSSWLVHGLRGHGLQVVCLDARQVRSVLKMRLNKTDLAPRSRSRRLCWSRPGGAG